ncbi:ATPase RavA [Myxococcaceae bacterium]|jgi:MoxR-like ATPase|nr:ATPase RavA [Myxococcaceae bacterium]
MAVAVDGSFLGGLAEREGGPATVRGAASESAVAERSREEIAKAARFVAPLRDEIGRVIVGQQRLVDRLLVALLADGHVLLEGVPGLAKTLSLRTLASAVRGRFQRIQFTPDMLPADVVGTLVYSPRDGSFVTRHGPIFANLVLADEINRAPAKVQSALLEAMQERQVTLGDETHPLPSPFVVMATQNPIEQEGTYALPEAQIDRFLLKVVVGYPSRAEERAILDRMTGSDASACVKPVVDADGILAARRATTAIYVDDRIKDYIVDLVQATRDPQAFAIDVGPYIRCGASPRATIALGVASRAWAFLQGRSFVTPQDVKSIGMDVLRHRVAVNYEAEAENVTPEDVVRRIFDGVAVP